MKSIINISILSVVVMSLISCGNDDTITDYRGQVKFETISVSSKLAGRISKMYVEEGQTVKKGDTLAYLDIPEVNAKMMQAEGAITSAQGQLDMAYKGATADQLNQIDGQIDAGRAQLNFAQESFNRMQNMYKDSLVSLQQFDEVRMKLNMAKAQVSSLNAKRKEVGNSARVEQIDQAKGQLNRAVGAKEEVLTAENEKFLIAPTDMSIETISLQEGELLSPGYTLFNGYEKTSVYFRFTIPESKIYDFKVGEKITLINPYTDQETEGEITTIKQLANYADITSTAPLYDLSESIYELKVVPTSNEASQSYFLNASILIKK